MNRAALFSGAIAMTISGCMSADITQAEEFIHPARYAGLVGSVEKEDAIRPLLGAPASSEVAGEVSRKMDGQADRIRRVVPGVSVERIGSGIVVDFPERVLFGFDRTELSNAADYRLEKLVSVLASYAHTRIEIQGHSDNLGSSYYNKLLTEKRAAAVALFIESRGVSPIRLEAKGYGDKVPIASNVTEKGRIKNRRVSVVISPGFEMLEEARSHNVQ